MKLSEFQPLNDSVFALFKGEPGTGKTIAAGSFPDPYFISTDQKVGSLKMYYPDRIEEIKFDFFNSYWDVYQRLEELQSNCPFKTVINDSLTRTARLAMQHSMQFRPDDRPKGKELGRSKGQLMLPEIEDYGAESQALWQVLYKLHDINQKWKCNVILIAHVVPTEGPKGTSRSILTGGKKIAAEIPGEFDEIYHFTVRRGLTSEMPNQYLALTHHEGEDFARTALPLDGAIDFTNGDFYKIWRSQIDSTKEVGSAPLTLNKQ